MRESREMSVFLQTACTVTAFNKSCLTSTDRLGRARCFSYRQEVDKSIKNTFCSVDGTQTQSEIVPTDD